ncbi:unnamed protein product, partial [marine sediment metagenome]
AIDEFNRKINIVNRQIIGAIITEESILNSIRLQIKKLSKDIKVSNEDINDILINDVIKRDIIDDETFRKAKAKVRRSLKK